MYKNDNFSTNDKCNEQLLRRIIEGAGNLSAFDDDGCDACDTCYTKACMEGGIKPDVKPDAKPEGGCVPDSAWGLKGYPLASVYAPLQSFDNIYELDAALKSGTLFAELNLPFEGRRIKKGDMGGGCRA